MEFLTCILAPFLSQQISFELFRDHCSEASSGSEVPGDWQRSPMKLDICLELSGA